MSTNDRIYYLLRAYASGSISGPEHDELFQLISTSEYDAIINKAIQQDLFYPVEQETGELPPHIAEQIVRNIFEAEKNTSRVLPLPTAKRARKEWAAPARWQMAAAAVLLLIATSAYFFFTHSPGTTKGLVETNIPSNAAALTNSDTQIKKVKLADGTVVTLQPGSSVHYTSQFGRKDREVYLQGEAFFEVVKDSSRPFLVYYRNIVTRVLGTSFTVNTNPHTGNVEVVVRTGRVQVFENDGPRTKNKKGVVVVPNQRAVFKLNDQLFETTLAEEPYPVMDAAHGVNATKLQFVYEQSTLEEVCKDLQAKYGIEMVLTNPALKNCIFTGDVSEQDLFTKLKIICLTTNSEYEINGTRILIRGEGCQ